MSTVNPFQLDRKLRFVILAPHVDDEVIGCWRLLNSGLVVGVAYFYEVDTVRGMEATRCADDFDFQIIEAHYIDQEMERVKANALLVPNIADYHPHHKAVNRLADSLEYRKYYYSVDMNVEMDVLSEEHQAQKQRQLLTLFPSQRRLIESTDKYHLFESLLSTDWVDMRVNSSDTRKQSIVSVKPL